MARVAVVTGASSGVGKAVSLRLAHEGWSVAAVARRREPLDEMIRAAGDPGKRITPFTADVSNENDVTAVAHQIETRLGPVSILVNNAGTNTPDRSWERITVDTFDELIAVNLRGTFLFTRAFLPGMRQRGDGTIINIASDAALAASPKAGGAYVAAKFGVRGLTQSINAEERQRGIRATAILPGDIDTPLLDRRPTPPTPDQRTRMLTPDDVAQCVMLAINLPPRAIIEELLIRPR